MIHNTQYLFGGKESWNAADWTASDDRVRGGKSQSYFDVSASEPIARFYGELDIKTLGGAGFASQRTTGENREWDLSEYDGIRLDITNADAKRYTFNLKDEILEKNPENGREQSTMSYEYDFKISESQSQSKSTLIYIPFDDLKATYRGREKEDAPPLNSKSVKRFSLMMRSFFGDQEGPFSLSIRSISAVTKKSDAKFSNAKVIDADFESGASRASNLGGQTRWQRGSKVVAWTLLCSVPLLVLLYREQAGMALHNLIGARCGSPW